MEITDDDRFFLKALGLGLAALAVSALLLLLFSYIYVAVTAPGGASNTYSKSIPGKQFKTIMGTSRTAGNNLEITGFKTHDDQEHALISLKTTFRAENYPFLSYQFQGWHTGMRINFIWRTASNPRKLNTTILNRSLDRPGMLNLANQPNWEGAITEVGLHVLGGLRGEALVIPEVTMEPNGWRSAVAAVFSEWTAFQGWAGTSINYVMGNPSTPGTKYLSPVLVAALWCGLTLLLLTIWFRGSSTKWGYVSKASAILIPWILVDLMWQSELNTQRSETSYVFGNKDMHQKHLADDDRDFYTYANRLKQYILPQSQDSRIFIIHNSTSHNYDRLKTQFYLLPNNVYNYGEIPPLKSLRVGDLILALGPLQSMKYFPETKTLSWEGHGNVKVRIIDEDNLGTLYEIVALSDFQSSTMKNAGPIQ